MYQVRVRAALSETDLDALNLIVNGSKIKSVLFLSSSKWTDQINYSRFRFFVDETWTCCMQNFLNYVIKNILASYSQY